MTIRLIDWLRIQLERLLETLRGDRLEGEMEEEMRFHLEMEMAERERMGMTPGEARRTALRDFGGVARFKEEMRAVRRSPGLEELARQIRLSARSLRRNPVFSLTLAGLLAVGIGAGAAIFALVDLTLLHPVPYPDPGSLVVIWNRAADAPLARAPVAAPHLARVAENVEGVESLAFTNRVLDVTLDGEEGEGGGRPAHARLALVTPGLFDVLGVDVARGRAFVGSDVDGAAGGGGEVGDVVVLSHGVWRAVFGGDEGIVGRSIRVEGRPLVVVGVLPADFKVTLPPDVGLPPRVDIWAPLGVALRSYRRVDRLRDRDSDNTGLGLARLRPGSDLRELRGELAALSRELAADDPAYRDARLALDAASLAEALTRRSGPLLRLLAAAGGLLLLAICVSAAGLVLARASTRRRELATRAALGAGRRRLAGELLVESGAFTLVAALPGAVLAWLGIRAARAFQVPGLVRADDLAMTPGVILVAAGIALLFAVVLSGVGAAAIFRSDLVGRPTPDRLRSGGPLRARAVLVGAQIALAFLLLASGAVLVRRLAELRNANLGFQPSGALAFDLSLRYVDAFEGPAVRARYINRLESSLRELVGVEAVGLVGRLPLSGRSWTQPYGPAGTTPEDWRDEANFRVVTSGFFAAAGVRVTSGRGFRPEEDLYEERRVVVLDRAMARRLGAPGAAVGRLISVPLDGAPVTARVVGVVEDVRFDDLGGPVRPTIYVPYRQEASREVSLVVRTRADPGGMVEGVREAVRALGVPLAPYNLRPLESYVRDRMAPNRLAFDLVGLLGLLTTLTALAGVYGLAVYTASLRRREVAIRMAVGAGPRDVLLEFLGGGTVIAGAGVGVGAVLILAVRPLLEAAAGSSMLDLALVGAAGIGLVLLVLAASASGARGAVRASPAEVLREDG